MRRTMVLFVVAVITGASLVDGADRHRVDVQVPGRSRAVIVTTVGCESELAEDLTRWMMMMTSDREVTQVVCTTSIDGETWAAVAFRGDDRLAAARRGTGGWAVHLEVDDLLATYPGHVEDLGFLLADGTPTAAYVVNGLPDERVSVAVAPLEGGGVETFATSQRDFQLVEGGGSRLLAVAGRTHIEFGAGHCDWEDHVIAVLGSPEHTPYRVTARVPCGRRQASEGWRRLYRETVERLERELARAGTVIEHYLNRAATSVTADAVVFRLDLDLDGDGTGEVLLRGGARLGRGSGPWQVYAPLGPGWRYLGAVGLDPQRVGCYEVADGVVGERPCDPSEEDARNRSVERAMLMAEQADLTEADSVHWSYAYNWEYVPEHAAPRPLAGPMAESGDSDRAEVLTE